MERERDSHSLHHTMPVSLDVKVTLLLLCGILLSFSGCDGRQIRRQPRMLGIDTGNAEADREAEMWLMALIGVLVAAVPVALLSPSLGFKRRRRRRDLSGGDIIEDFVIRALLESDNV